VGDGPERAAAPSDPAAAAPGEPEPTGFVYVCERCGALMEEIHCKIMCKTCGYFRDCSDP